MELRVQAVACEGKGRGRNETTMKAPQNLDQPAELILCIDCEVFPKTGQNSQTLYATLLSH